MILDTFGLIEESFKWLQTVDYSDIDDQEEQASYMQSMGLT